MNIDETRAQLAALQAEIRSLVASDAATPELDAELDIKLGEFEVRKADLAKLEERATKIAAVDAMETRRIDGMPSFSVSKDKVAPTDVRNLSRSEARDAALRVIEADGSKLAERQLRHVDALVRSHNEDQDGDSVARRILLTENPSYRTGWQKAVSGRPELINNDERRALEEFRAMSDGTGSAGGYGLPVLIDPSIILTSQAANAPILDVCRVVTITTNVWKGVTSAGMAWGYGAEAAVVTDGSPTLAQPSIAVQRATGFIPYSIEVEQDYPGFAEEMAKLLAAGYTDLIANNTLTGVGTGTTPKGIFTSVNASAGSLTATTTAGVLSATDVANVYGAQLERFRANASWIMNVATEDSIRLFSTGGPGGTFSVDLQQPGIPKLFGKTVLRSDYAPKQPTGTTAGTFAVVGDFSQFVFVQRAGMTVEPVSHLFDPTTGRPTGQRGWLAVARNGFDVTSSTAFRGLTNKTS